jgi:antimicrobial peptide system SdpB family protein
MSQPSPSGPDAPASVAEVWERFVAWQSQPRYLVGASLFRLCAGLAVLIEYLINYSQRRYLFGPDGLFPYATFVAEVARSPRDFSVYAWSASPVYFEVCYHLGILVAVLWFLGWRTRWLTPLQWVFLWSLHQRFPGIWDGGDNIIQLILVYACFADVSAHFSLDAERRQGREPGAWAPVGAFFHNTAMLAFAVQISLVYGLAGLYKVQGGVWQDGTAIYYAFRNGQFVIPGVTEWFYRSAFVVTALSYTTVAFQVAFPFLLFLNPHTRKVAVVMGFTFHVGIALVLGLVTFSLFMTSVDLALMGDAEYRAMGRFLARLRQRFFSKPSPAATEAPVLAEPSPGSPPPAA